MEPAHQMHVHGERNTRKGLDNCVGPLRKRYVIPMYVLVVLRKA